MNRVVITGMGIISPVGNNVKEYENALRAGKNGIGVIDRFDISNSKARLAGEVKNFNALDYFADIVEVRRTDLFSQYAIAAATEAVNDSGISGKIDETRLGVYFGSGIGGLTTFENEHTALMTKGERRVSALFIPMLISNMAAGMISIRFHAKGPTLPVITACATSTNAIGEAYRAIKHGYADAIISGGSEAAITPMGIAGFTNCKALSLAQDENEASLPFDKRRAGFVMGEGAASLVLESYDHAVARGAKIYAEVVGYGNTSDAYHVTSPCPDGSGAARAIEMAAKEGGVAPNETLYINAHGTGTLANDKAETAAYKQVFGADAYKIHISSTKSMTGHMLGAAGAAEAVASVLALCGNFVPPTINYKEKDEECDLDYTPNEAAEARLEYALSSSFGFGGHNAVIALKKFGG